MGNPGTAQETVVQDLSVAVTGLGAGHTPPLPSPCQDRVNTRK